jgi:ATP/maltotriose-dependent transcriptional regulator MalT
LADTINKKDLVQEIERDAHHQAVHHLLPLVEEDIIQNITEKGEEEVLLHHHLLQALPAVIAEAVVAIPQSVIRGKADLDQEIKGSISDYDFNL